jgi:hypothetical protein
MNPRKPLRVGTEVGRVRGSRSATDLSIYPITTLERSGAHVRPSFCRSAGGLRMVRPAGPFEFDTVLSRTWNHVRSRDGGDQSAESGCGSRRRTARVGSGSLYARYIGPSNRGEKALIAISGRMVV